MRYWIAVCLLMGTGTYLQADGPGDNSPESVRQIPPPGIEIPAADLEQLQSGLSELEEVLDRLRLRRDARTPQLLPDVEIFQRAVRQAITFSELYSPGEIKQAQEVLREGLQRARQLLEGAAPWTTQTGLVVRGFRSELDGTVQPYGLVIPAEYDPEGVPVRCDLWFHGRNEKILEVQFIHQRLKSIGQIQPAGTIVLHPFGRYSNAFKFAGEVDVWEALAHARQNYRIDDRRIAVRGFSMGGAGAWHFAVHYPRKFFAATPGAGFSETPEFLKSFQNEKLQPPFWEERLWMLYDCPPWVENLRQIPTIAYSGELDKQKQAADVMEAACREIGLELVHLIGPETAHKIHPDSLVEIERRLAELADRGTGRRGNRRADGANRAMAGNTAVTATLKYHDFGNIVFHGLEEHWRMSRISVERADRKLVVTTTGVTDFALRQPRGNDTAPRQVVVNGTALETAATPGAAGNFLRFYREGDSWKSGTPPETPGALRKKPNLQGPIDDAFMGSFLIVAPDGQSTHPAVEEWVQAELTHARAHWRQQMRGDARVKSAAEVTAADIEQHHLILFGDPESNSLIARLFRQLPLRWTESTLELNGQSYSAASHLPALVYPNPLNPERYVVLNSGFTYREYDYLNNARQTPKLPDWAVLDVTTGRNARWSAKVVAADFFGERWEFRP